MLQFGNGNAKIFAYRLVLWSIQCINAEMVISHGLNYT